MNNNMCTSYTPTNRGLLRRFSASISDLLNIQRKNHGRDGSESGTALHHAVQMGNTIMTRTLLECRMVWVDEEDSKGRTALHYAVQQNNTELTSLLLTNRANVDALDYCGCSAAHFACKEGMIDAVNLLTYYKADLCAVDKYGRTPFDLACEYGRGKLVDRMLESGIPIRSFEETSLNCSHRRRASALHLAARNGHVEICYRLIERGWPINQLTSQGSALHEAVTQGHVEVVRFLLYAGIDANALNAYDQTAADVSRKALTRSPITSKEIRFLLREYRNFVHARAVYDFNGIATDELTFSVGDNIWVVDRETSKTRWKGIIFGAKAHSRCGLFAASAVELVSAGVDERQTRQVATINNFLAGDRILGINTTTNATNSSSTYNKSASRSSIKSLCKSTSLTTAGSGMNNIGSNTNNNNNNSDATTNNNMSNCSMGSTKTIQRHMKKVSIPIVPDIGNMKKMSSCSTNQQMNDNSSASSSVSSPLLYHLPNSQHQQQQQYSCKQPSSSFSTSNNNNNYHNNTASNYHHIAHRSVLSNTRQHQTATAQGPNALLATNNHQNSLPSHMYSIRQSLIPSSSQLQQSGGYTMMNMNDNAHHQCAIVSEELLSDECHRNSTGSNSSRTSSSGFESMKSGCSSSKGGGVVASASAASSTSSSFLAAASSSSSVPGLMRGCDSPQSRVSVHSQGSVASASGSSTTSGGSNSSSHCQGAGSSSIISQTSSSSIILDAPQSQFDESCISSSSLTPNINNTSSLLINHSLIDHSNASSLLLPLSVPDMVRKQIPEAEILALWLDRLGRSEYLSVFLTQGYDLATIARITPEDLIALGITQPAHRKQLIAEIHTWNITDSWPFALPSGDLGEWLALIGLPEYLELFESQGYYSMDEVQKLNWEDFEDIGIKKLGHLKRLGLAIKKMLDYRLGRLNMLEHANMITVAPYGSRMGAQVKSPPPPPPPSSTGRVSSPAGDGMRYHAPPPPPAPSSSSISTFHYDNNNSNYMLSDQDNSSSHMNEGSSLPYAHHYATWTRSGRCASAVVSTGVAERGEEGCAVSCSGAPSSACKSTFSSCQTANKVDKHQQNASYLRQHDAHTTIPSSSTTPNMIRNCNTQNKPTVQVYPHHRPNAAPSSKQYEKHQQDEDSNGGDETVVLDDHGLAQLGVYTKTEKKKSASNLNHHNLYGDHHDDNYMELVDEPKKYIRLNLYSPARILSDEAYPGSLTTDVNGSGMKRHSAGCFVNESGATDRIQQMQKHSVAKEQEQVTAVESSSSLIDNPTATTTSSTTTSDSEDYPPPPAPLACEGSIRLLRSAFRTSSPASTVAPASSCCTAGTATNVNGRTTPMVGVTMTSNCASNECVLPFANDNCGTIRSSSRSANCTCNIDNNTTTASSLKDYQKTAACGLGSEAISGTQRRPTTIANHHQNSLFTAATGAMSNQVVVPLDHNNSSSVIPTDISKCYRMTANGDVLNDIGFMLQNLTDELDAMLLPKQQQKHFIPNENPSLIN